MLIKIFLAFGFLLGFQQSAFATRCVKADWTPLCGTTSIGATSIVGSRCISTRESRVGIKALCAPDVPGCKSLGGCTGFTPNQHWAPIIVDGHTLRCRCGCFTENTRFAGPSMMTGSDLISLDREANGNFGSVQMDIFNPDVEYFSTGTVSSFVWGMEKKDIFTFYTEKGSVSVTSEHPVVVGDKNGKFQSVKVPGLIEEGQFLITDGFEASRILKIVEEPYDGLVVNFVVDEEDPMSHFVSANGFLMGDNAWQQTLAMKDARILKRADIAAELNK